MPKAEILYKNGDEYNGELQNNLFHGQGLYKFKNGSLYQGQFSQGKFHGRGRLIDKINDINVVGEFKDGKMNGYVRIMYGDGSQYEGMAKNGSRDGKGVYNYAKSTGQNDAPQKYEGQFVEDSYEGYGQLTFASKSKYKGHFQNNLFNGQGNFQTSDYLYIGQFRNGQIEGKGIQKYTNGQFYDGQFQLNMKNGYGRYCWNDGTTYEGMWKDDLRVGKGKITRELKDHSKQQFQGDFQGDTCNGQIKAKLNQYDIIAQLKHGKLHGPIKLSNQGTLIQSNYKNGVKNGRTLIEKNNKYGQTVTYCGQFKKGEQNPYTVSYSHRF